MSYVTPLNLLSAVVVMDESLPSYSLLDASQDGDRTFRQLIVFDRSFGSAPLVHVGLVGVDASKDDNLRLRLRAEDITPAGFTLVAETWLNTKIWSVEASWLAIGN